MQVFNAMCGRFDGNAIFISVQLVTHLQHCNNASFFHDLHTLCSIYGITQRRPQAVITSAEECNPNKYCSKIPYS